MKTRSRHPWVGIVYALAVGVALFTGFGNMPLYGRYYVADVPGLGWSANFFTNVNVHILSGSLLLGIGLYALASFLLARSATAARLTLSGKIRGALLAVALMTGILMAIKNLPGIHFPFRFLMIANFAHMGAAMVFMFTALTAMLLRKPWITGP